MKNILGGTKVSDLGELVRFIDAFCVSSDNNIVALALDVLDVPPKLRMLAVNRWILDGRPTLDAFAPYSTHVFKVDLLYYLGMHRGFISSERASNRVDMAYLYYLPFAVAFVSGDRLHQRTVPLLHGVDQSYVPADELKSALAEIDDYYDGLPDEVKALGLMSFASWPPSDMDNLVTRLFDDHMRKDWRDEAQRHEAPGQARDPDADRAAVDELHAQMSRARPMTDEESKSAPPELDYGMIRRQVPVKKGKWRMVSKEVEDAAD